MILDEQTYSKLMDMKLTAMAEAFLELLKDAPSNQMSFGEKMGYMVDRSGESPVVPTTASRKTQQ